MLENASVILRLPKTWQYAVRMPGGGGVRNS
jgi:hypothetical protein